MKLYLAAALSIVALAVSAPTSVPYGIHEKREHNVDGWALASRASRSAKVPISIGLAQRNLERGHDLLMDVSHPKSSNYGKHWTAEEILETFAPSQESIESVISWLTESGISESRITLSRGRNWLRFEATIAELEELLHAEYSIYEHSATGTKHLACEEYSVPVDIKSHVDIITPTIHFDAKISNPVKQNEVSRSPSKRDVSVVQPGKNNAWAPKQGEIISTPNTVPQPEVVYNLANCNQYITPDCLRALYNFSNGTLSKSSYGIVEYTPQAYLQSDLNVFYNNLARQIPSGTGPTVDLIDGAIVQTTTQSFNDNGESDLDLQYAIALVYPQKVTLYQVGDTVEGASFNNFLDALDASYCTSGGGDDSTQDGIYPDTQSGGYKGAEDCGDFSATSVISTSYGYNEADLSLAYEQRQCNEYMKLGLQGISILYSSGDYGVAGNGGQCCTKAQCAGGTYNSGTKGSFNPSFPSTCPYVTSVGATQIKTGASVTAPETACETVIYSGGGFSNRFPIPSYQSSAVTSYFANHAPTYTSTQYNNSRNVRAYPDVSANGANYVVAVDGSLSLVYGTSASSPVFGSIITLINEQLIAAGKPVAGFLNPVLYENPSAFNDIVSGGNQGCGTSGFTAVTGWDPVTGLGTPNYQSLLAVFLAL